MVRLHWFWPVRLCPVRYMKGDATMGILSARTRRYAGRALYVSFVLLAGCGVGTNVLTSILGSNVDEQFGMNGVDIRIINQSTATEELDILVDGQPYTISCLSAVQICDFYLSTCPQRVEAVSERRLDTAGRFVGGRNFEGSDACTFDSGEGEFNCGDFLIYRFSDTEADAFVL